MDTTNQGLLASSSPKIDKFKLRNVTVDEFCRLAISRRHLVRQQNGTQQGLVDEETGESFWVEEVRFWSLGGLL